MDACKSTCPCAVAFLWLYSCHHATDTTYRTEIAERHA
jgi:hypothetical protein